MVDTGHAKGDAQRVPQWLPTRKPHASSPARPHTRLYPALSPQELFRIKKPCLVLAAATAVLAAALAPAMSARQQAAVQFECGVLSPALVERRGYEGGWEFIESRAHKRDAEVDEYLFKRVRR